MGVLDFLTAQKQQQSGTSETQQANESSSSASQVLDNIKSVLSKTSGVSGTEQTGTQKTGTEGRTAQTGFSTGVSAQDSSLFSEEILGVFEGLTLGAAGRAADAADSTTLLSGLAFDKAQDFNIEDFVNRTVRGSAEILNENRDAQVNALGSATGGSALTSTVTKNLQESLLRKDKASLAATAAGAEATGQQIQGQNLQEAAALGNLDIQNFLALATGLKGGQTTSISEQSGTQESLGSEESTGITDSSSVATTKTETQTATEETLKQIMEALQKSQATSEQSNQTTGTGSSTGSIMDVVAGVSGLITAIMSGN